MSEKGMTSADWLEHVVAWRHSGLSQAAYERLQGFRHRYLHNSPAQKLTSSRFEVQEFVGGV
jgi:hypothetical protein